MSGVVQFGAELFSDLEAAESREWLVTNGIGGYASGTLAGGMSRRYHGLLVAALRPPVGRTQLVAWIDEIVRYNGAEFALATHRWASGAIEPQGFQHIEGFRLEGTMPVWTYAIGDARLEKRIWMQRGANTTYVQYTMVQGSGSLEMELKALVNYRDFHATTHAGDWRMSVEPIARGVRVVAFENATPFYLMSKETIYEARHEWYRDYFFAEEKKRGLDDREDHLFAALFRAKLDVGKSLAIVLTTEANADLNGEATRKQRVAYESTLLSAADLLKQEPGADSPEWLRQLVLAADQFIVKRALPDEPDGRSVIAGYHWFADWGRDTMIALPGLTLAPRRSEVAKQILLAFARYVDGGMLPNNFPDSGGQPEYNTLDAAFWYFEAIRQYVAVTDDQSTLQKFFPVLAGIVDAHVRGTRYQIHVDSADGLLYAGESGVQLTWMDAKVGDWVVTPRIGKPVEINALWYNALCVMTAFAEALGRPAELYRSLADRVRVSFARFADEHTGGLYDVLDGPLGDDGPVRPNQIFAVSLPHSPLPPTTQAQVVALVGRRLLTSYGLRSLSANHPDYKPHYTGDPWHRDGAYHQGTVWAWLLGHYALAEYRVHGDADSALERIAAMRDHLFDAGLGTISEIFEAEPPHLPSGTPSQAWSVACVLEAWWRIKRAITVSKR